MHTNGEFRYGVKNFISVSGGLSKLLSKLDHLSTTFSDNGFENHDSELKEVGFVCKEITYQKWFFKPGKGMKRLTHFEMVDKFRTNNEIEYCQHG